MKYLKQFSIFESKKSKEDKTDKAQEMIDAFKKKYGTELDERFDVDQIKLIESAFGFFDKNHQHSYIWGKRFENLWTWVTVAYSKEESAYYFYINDELQCNINDIKKNTSFPVENTLKSHDIRLTLRIIIHSKNNLLSIRISLF